MSEIRKLRTEAESGSEQAWYELGMFYYHGNKGLPKDLENAAEHFKLSANGGYAPAQYVLGIIYSRGEGVEQDHEESRRWYEKAADQGHDGAQQALKSIEDEEDEED